MGILDEAIRQHLDLKRRHGAQDSEVKKLEDEAFGLPTRPGEPDFPESQEHSVVPAEADEKKAPEAEPEPAASEQPAAEVAEAPPQPEVEAPPQPEPETAEPAAEQAPVEEPTAGASGFYDHAAAEQEELEDSADDELEEVGLADVPPASEEHPVTSMETVEHPMEEELDEVAADAPATGEEPLPEGPPTDEELLPEPPITGEEESVPEPPITGEEEPVPEAPITGEEESPEDDSDGDVLEETPEFLRDQPEDDELWFEQGEPKDFDFD